MINAYEPAVSYEASVERIEPGGTVAALDVQDLIELAKLVNTERDTKLIVNDEFIGAEYSAALSALLKKLLRMIADTKRLL